MKLNGTDPTTANDWEAGPISYAELVPLGKQFAPIFRTGTNRIEIVFSEDVVPNGSTLENALKLWGSGNQGAAAPLEITHTGFAYDSDTDTGTWTFNNLGPDKYRIDLMATDVLDGSGNLLDGDWVNADGPVDMNEVVTPTPDNFSDDPTGRTFPSGHGMPGESFQFLFSLLPGDYNQDGMVSASGDNSDLLVLGDGNGSGGIDAADSDLVTTTIIPGCTSLVDRGDYFDDEYIDAADYAMWLSTFGQSVEASTGADGNGDGIIDAADYITWRYWEYTQGAWYTGPSGLGALLPIVDFANAPTRC